MRNALHRKNILIFSLSIFFLASPVFVFAQSPSNSGTTGLTYECTGKDYGECSFEDVIAAVKNILNKGTVIALEFTVVVIAFAGWNYMMSGDNPGKRRDANEMLRKVAVGIFLILAAWLIVTLILNGLGVTAPRFLG